jgi:hypothetical protein
MEARRSGWSLARAPPGDKGVPDMVFLETYA